MFGPPKLIWIDFVKNWIDAWIILYKAISPFTSLTKYVDQVFKYRVSRILISMKLINKHIIRENSQIFPTWGQAIKYTLKILSGV